MKKKLLLLVSCILILGSANAQSPDWQWAKAIGGIGVNGDKGFSITTDALGNVYTCGRFTGTADFDPGAGIFNLTAIGEVDIFISKLDSAGNFIWARAMSGVGYEAAISIAVDASGNVFTTGGFQSTVDFDPGPGIFNLTAPGPVGTYDIFISKLDSAGNFVWAKRIGSIDNDSGNSIALDDSANVYTTGYFNITVDFDPGPGVFNLTSPGYDDIFVSKLDSSGNFVWAKRIGGSGYSYQVGLSITIDRTGSGDVYTTGYFQNTVDFDPGPGVFNLTADTTISTYNNDIFISRLDASGNFVWAKRMGGPGVDAGRSIALDTSGNVYIAGQFSGTSDFNPDTAVTYYLNSAGLYDIFISKMNTGGNFIWAKALGGTAQDIALSVAIDAFSYVYTTGSFAATADFDPGPGVFNLTPAGSVNIFVSKLDSAGNFVWAKATGGTGGDAGCSIALSASGNVHVTGEFSSPSISFGSTTLMTVSIGTADIFIAKLDSSAGIPTGNNWSENFAGSIFPNPFTTTATISFDKEVRGAAFSLYNLLGEKVAEISGINGESYQLNRASLTSGMYVYEVKEKGRSIGRGKAVVY